MCVLQEELAFVFEMLQQFEDALVQYDELDALFTQYVLNFGAGGKKSPSSAKSPFQIFFFFLFSQSGESHH